MSLIQMLFGQESASDLTLTSERGWDRTGFYGYSTSSGECITPESALAISTYFACVRNLSVDVAKLPLKMYRRIARGKEVAPEHPLYPILHDSPNPEMTAFSYWETMVQWMAAWGGGFSEIQPDISGRPRRLWPIHPSMVTVKRGPSGVLYYEVREKSGGIRNIPSERMFHVHGMGYDGITGYSIAQIAAESLGVAKAAQNFAGSFFGNGATPSGLLTTDQTLKPEQGTQLREEWDKVHRGSKNANKTAILHGGLKYVPMGMPLRDAQFLEARQFQKEEIAQWFRMPLAQLQDSKRAQGWSTLDALNKDYITYTLSPFLIIIRQEIARKLLLENERDEYFAQHDDRAFMFGDAKSRIEYFKGRADTQSITPNEIREIENENPLDDPDSDKPIKPSAPSAPQASADKRTQPSESNNEPESQEHMRVLFMDAARRSVRREVNANEAAMKRHGKDATAFRKWQGQFKDEQRRYMIDAFEPICNAMHRIGEFVPAVLDAYLDKNEKRVVAAFIVGTGERESRAIENEFSLLANDVFSSVMMEKKQNTLRTVAATGKVLEKQNA